MLFYIYLYLSFQQVFLQSFLLLQFLFLELVQLELLLFLLLELQLLHFLLSFGKTCEIIVAYGRLVFKLRIC